MQSQYRKPEIIQSYMRRHKNSQTVACLMGISNATLTTPDTLRCGTQEPNKCTTPKVGIAQMYKSHGEAFLKKRLDSGRVSAAPRRSKITRNIFPEFASGFSRQEA